MKRVLMFGDLHVPTRADAIPKAFYDYISHQHYDLCLVTGDLVQEDKMRAVMPPLPTCYIAQGNMDMGARHEFHHELQIEGLSFLLLHGTQLRPRGNLDQLWEIAKNIGAHVTVHGHTHTPSIDVHKGRLFLNPGTITGATGGWGGRKDASFLEAVISSLNIDVTLFYTNWQVVKESRLHFRLEDETMTQVQ